LTQNDPTVFVMDPDLVVRSARGESILRLPWFDESLFVGRQLPDIREIPARILDRAVESYLTALRGDRCWYSFRSYGHGFSVDAIPVRDAAGRVEAVVAVAEPVTGYPAAARAYESAAERFERSALLAEASAERHRRRDRVDAQNRELAKAERAWMAAERARANAVRLRGGATAAVAEPLELTAREAEILALASHGLTFKEIGEQLIVSPATVRAHLEKIYPKLGVTDKAAAVATALRHGLID
jgi:DNA-binding CsgD family transcriptional regulator